MMVRVQLRGLGVSSGLAVGPVLRMVGGVPEPAPDDPPREDPVGERVRALRALATVAAELEERGRLSGGEAEAVLEAQAMMARDPGLAEAVGQAIDSGRSAARAVFDAFATYRELIARAGDDYLAARVADLDDVRDRAIAALQGLPTPRIPRTDIPHILVAGDLAPADTASLDPRVTLGLLTEQGGPTSHTAILARAMGVAAVVGCPGATELADGTVVLLDGGTGRVLVAPSADEIAAAKASVAARASTLARRSGPAATADGHRVPLLANVGRPEDLEAAASSGAEGVGLYRTEFLFLDRLAPPSEDEQAHVYASALAAFPSGRVVVRVLDAGADKPLAFLPAGGGEPNPALGVRGLRLLRRHRDILDVQLRALARARGGGRGTLEVMAPMVSDAADARWFVEACRAAGLIGGGIGVMVEVPAAALRAASIAAEVDFFSIGTNDLAQYTLAADRQLGALSRLQDPWQPAVLDLVAAAADAATDAGKGCGVCGEAAADAALACVLVGLGVTNLSMTPAALTAVRAGLRAHSLEQCRAAAAAARAGTTAEEARGLARAALPALASLGL
jgi:phosphotransferase system enzyme I (PtsI)